MRISRQAQAVALGAFGVILFSFTVPATREAAPVFGGFVVGLGRSLIAAVLAIALLLLKREPFLPRRYWRQVAVIACGVVFGFPVFLSIALQYLTSAHTAVIVGMLPAATAVLAVVRAGERPSLGFWLAAGCGLIAVVVFAAVQGAGQPQPADVLVLIAVLLAALGYAEGAVLARDIGGWRVISWVLVFSFPILVPVVGLSLFHQSIKPTSGAWLGFGYVALVSAYLGFFPWYRALALGGVARISQLQLAQPVLTLVWSALLLGEHIDAITVLAAVIVLISVAMSQRMRIQGAVEVGDPPRATLIPAEDQASVRS